MDLEEEPDELDPVIDTIVPLEEKKRGGGGQVFGKAGGGTGRVKAGLPKLKPTDGEGQL